MTVLSAGYIARTVFVILEAVIINVTVLNFYGKPRRL